jgi:hypothetical protein
MFVVFVVQKNLVIILILGPNIGMCNVRIANLVASRCLIDVIHPRSAYRSKPTPVHKS